jgi:dipeptidyl aminopeptidase/acylaminoacyl peptidase
MNERDLRDALRDAVPEDDAARRRAWQVVQAAYGELEPRRRRPLRPRRLLALAVAATLVPVAAGGGAAASAPHSAVGHWVRGVLGVGDRDARPALARVPGGGRLLVAGGDGVWVVSADGSKRRLGSYVGASWSPHGRFVVAWRGRELTALDPAGKVRWSLARQQPVALARWAPVDGFRIAYLAGGALRVVGGDGTDDHRYAAARQDVAPAWRPDNRHVLAYVDARNRVDVVAVDSRTRLGRSAPLTDPRELAWSADGRRLMATTRRRVILFDGAGRRLRSRAMPAASVVADAEWAPDGARIAVVRRTPGAGRSDVLLLDPERGLRMRALFGGPGRFGALAWSPSGERLLVSWPEPDQWLFLRPRGGRRDAVANIARQFMPGAARPSFPRAVQWCCAARRPAR